jgi:DNA-directed RNA polymerase specialized sigma subunit
MMTAKEYLQQYKSVQREIDDLDYRMAQLRLKYAAPSAIEYSDMPKAHNTEHDLSDYVAKMDEMTDYMISKYTRLRGIEVSIYKRLDRMDNQDERELLRLRYIDGLTWSQIADRLSTVERNVYFIHGRALQHFPMD